MPDELVTIGVPLPEFTTPGTVVGGTNPVTIAPSLEIDWGGGNAPALGSFGIQASGPLGGNATGQPSLDLWSSVRNTPGFREFLTTAEGQAWEDVKDQYGSRYTFYDPVRYGPRESVSGGPLGKNWRGPRDYYDRQLEYHRGLAMGPTAQPEFEEETSSMSMFPIVTDWLAPDTPGNQIRLGEAEDQWWETGLEAIGDLVTPIAQYWINRGIEELHDWAMPGRDQPRQVGPGTPPAPTTYTDPAIIDVTPTHQGAPPMAQVPTSLPGGASVVPSQQSGNQAGAPWCIAPGSATITQRRGTSMRLPSTVDVPTVDRSGNVRYTTYKNMGRPVLFSGDYAAAKRVNKVAAKSRRKRGGR